MTQQPRIVVLGSINLDLVANCDQLPRPGETLTAKAYREVFGGKGANQAIAAARAGGAVQMIGRVGDDAVAARLRQNLQANRIDCSAVLTSASCPSGLAMLVVDNAGENQIVVVPGANALVTPEDVDRYADLIGASDCLLVQLEVPLATVVHAVEIARRLGVRVILDPAPVPSGAIPESLLSVDFLCPNETEAMRLAGVADETPESMEIAAQRLHDRGARQVAITRGADGTLLHDGRCTRNVDTLSITAVDCTGAGDAFAGAFAVCWAETNDLLHAVRWGNVAGALAASRHGAQDGIPARADIDDTYRKSRAAR